MKRIIGLIFLCFLSSQLFAIKKDSLKYRNSIEFNYQRNYSFRTIISYSDAIVKDAAEQIAKKEQNESAVYTNIIGIFYTYHITPWLYLRSGFSTGTLGYISKPQQVPLYEYPYGQPVLIGYQKVVETAPGTFLNMPFQIGIQKEIKRLHLTPFLMFGYEIRSIFSPSKTLGDGQISNLQNSLFYKFQVKNDYDISGAKKQSGYAFSYYSLTSGINFNVKRFKIGLYYQYRGSSKLPINNDRWGNLNIVERKFAHGLGISLGYNF
jgi:hypothetical protein